MTATMTDTPPAAPDSRAAALHLIVRKRAAAIAAPVLVLVYLAYVFVAFDVGGLVQRAKMDNAVILLSDAVSYKIHVTRDNRNDSLAVSVEGSRRAVFPEGLTGRGWPRPAGWTGRRCATGCTATTPRGWRA